MSNDVLERLRENAKKKVGLVRNVNTKLTDEEFAVLEKNSEELGMEIGELLREFILTTSAYGEKPNVKSSKPKTVRKTVKVKGGNE
jgi:hypothetical protein